MARYERVSEIYDLFWSTREPQSLEALCSALGVSTATAKRLIKFLREKGTPIRFVREANGYVLDRDAAPSVSHRRSSDCGSRVDQNRS